MMNLFVLLVLLYPAIVDVKSTVEQDCLILHNRLRARHAVPDLQLSSSLCEDCQAYAAVMAKSQVLEHSQNEGNYTENIEVTIGNPLKSVKKWYDEIEYYNFHQPGYSEDTCHFTALVWKSSEMFGYGQADDSEGKTYLVARYVPAGNQEGKYRENVRKLRRRSMRNKGICLFVNFHNFVIAQITILLLYH
ncbi:uncharacterized protein Dana_GF28048, isoform B [Drosophila ananassae]|uniref:Uncharacterized protein, isoform B n=1 Tax=Drosophila ananassae TaxID=7217 RepID=A0A0P8YMV9_DROAN|nr:Golgi-associated plant pathogenesis-related protein 1 isoform X2 [Drosophila ananassae]KPU80125.1 uncharacterized protein Dana_GF28048, isoform B [Drosophila ananassae]